MRRYIKWIAVFFVALVLTALFEPILMGAVEDTGFHDDPVNTVKPAVNWIARLIGNDAFPWAAGIIIGFALGVWLDYFIRGLGRKKTEEVVRLGCDAISLSGQLDILSNNCLVSPTSYPPYRLDPDIDIIRSKLAKRGIHFVVREDVSELLSEDRKKAQSDYLAILSSELRAIGKYLETGDVKTAKEKSEGLLKLKRAEAKAAKTFKEAYLEQAARDIEKKYPKQPAANTL